MNTDIIRHNRVPGAKNLSLSASTPSPTGSLLRIRWGEVGRRPDEVSAGVTKVAEGPGEGRPRPGEGRAGRNKSWSEVHPFPFLLVIFLLLLLSPFHTTSAAVTFTNAVVISETNTNYDGQDIIIDGPTVAIDGPHSFNSVPLTNNAVLTRSTR